MRHAPSGQIEHWQITPEVAAVSSFDPTFQSARRRIIARAHGLLHCHCQIVAMDSSPLASRLHSILVSLLSYFRNSAFLFQNHRRGFVRIFYASYRSSCEPTARSRALHGLILGSPPSQLFAATARGTPSCLVGLGARAVSVAPARVASIKLCLIPVFQLCSDASKFIETHLTPVQTIRIVPVLPSILLCCQCFDGLPGLAGMGRARAL